MKSFLSMVAAVVLLSLAALAQPQHTFLLYSDNLDDPSTAVFSDIQNTNGEFLDGLGWQATLTSSQLFLKFVEDLPDEGTLIIDVTNFNPVRQNSSDKQQIINLYSRPEGSKEAYQGDAAWWNIRTGTNYSLGEGQAGFKFLSAPRGLDTREETRCIEDKSDWDLDETYEFKVVWTAQKIYCFFDGQRLAEFNFAGQVESLQYLFLGTDNVYQAQPGPIYSNLRILIDDPNKVDISFTDVTESYNVAGHSDAGYGHGISFADVDQNGKLDLFVSNAVRELELPDMLFVNQGDWFSEQAERRGTLDRGLTHSIVSFDLDNDGDLDNFFSNMSIFPDKSDGLGRNALYQNNGGGYYSDITNNGISNELNDSRGAIALDIDNDGRLDLYAVNWGQENEMYLNLGNGEMKRVDRGANGPDGDTSAQQGVTAADFDMDGDIDIYVSRRETGNWLLVNDGNGNFVDKGGELNVDVDGRTNGAIFGDIDNDADLDLFVINSGYSQNDQPLLRVFYNNGDGTFEDKSDDYDIHASAFSASLGDIDNDADLDLFLLYNSEKDANASPYIFLNDGTGKLEKITCGVEVLPRDARAVSYGDIDNDGDIDFYLTAKFGRNYLLRNDLVSSNNYIDILCFGPGGDYGGFGSKVFVYEPGYLGSPNHLLGFQESVSNYAYLCQNQTALHFGLAQNNSCDIRIIRTDGQFFDFRNVPANQFFNMNENEPEQYSLQYESGDNQIAFVDEELSQPFVVRVTDQNGAGIAGAQVTFTPENGGTIRADQPIVTDADGYARAFFTLGPTPGLYDVTATSSLTEDAKVVFHAQAKEYQISISKNFGDDQVGTVGQDLPSPLVVQALYENGKVASNVEVTFFVEPGNGTVDGDSKFTTFTDETGKARAVWTLGESVGEQQLFVSYKDEKLQFSATALAGDAAKIVADSLAAQEFVAGKSYPVTCHVFDLFDNPSPNQDVTFTVLSGAGSLDGQAHQTVASDVDGRVEIVWTLGLNHMKENRLMASIASDSVVWMVDKIQPPLLTNSTITARDSIAADGLDSTRITIQLLNEKNQPLPDYPVVIHVSGTENELIDQSAKTDKDGLYVAVLKSSFPEIKYVTAHVADVGVVPDTLELEFYQPAPKGVHLVHVSGDRQTVIAGHQPEHALKVRVVDEDENPVPDKKVRFQLSNNQADFEGGGFTTATSDADGLVGVSLNVKPVIQHQVIRVQATIPDDSTAHTFTIYMIPAAPASMSRLSADSLVVNPRDSLKLAVRLRDKFGNNTPNVLVNFSSDGDDFFSPDSSIQSDSLGIAQTTVIAGYPSTWHHINISADSLFSTFVFHVSLIEHLEKMTQDTILLKDENEAALLQIKCFDAFDEPVVHLPVRFRIIDGQGEFEQQPDQLSDNDGIVQIKWRPDSQSLLSIVQATSAHDSVRFVVKRDVPSFVTTNTLPDDFALGANYPNPFNPTTTIPFSVPVVSHVAINVYNLQGQKVRTLINDQMQPGQHVVIFDMKDDVGLALPSGVYFYRMNTDGFEAKKRLLFLK